MSANIRIKAIVIIIYAILIAAPDRHVYAKGPRADTFYSFSESGPFSSMEIFLTWEKATQAGYIYPLHPVDACFLHKTPTSLKMQHSEIIDVAYSAIMIWMHYPVKGKGQPIRG